MKLGARILKTGVAIVLSLYIALLLKLEPPMFAALAAIFAIQPSIYRSYQTILEQIQANIIGAVFAVLFVLTFGHEPFVIGLVCIIVIAINLKLKFETAIPIAVVTVIIIMESPTDNFIEFASTRFLLILIGVVSAFIVNLFFIPPKYETKLYHKIVDNTESIIQWIRLIIKHDTDPKALKKDLTRLRESMVKMETLFLFYKEERNYQRKKRQSKARKLVVFKQMLNATNKALFLLKNLRRHEHELHHMPKHFQDLIQSQLEDLTSYHERILLTFIGKVRPHTDNDIYIEVSNKKQTLTETFMDFYDTQQVDRTEWLHIFPILGLIIDYSDQLERLDKLVINFYNHHSADNEIYVKEDKD
ncbi:FUSC family protein [Anaerobacillus sp. MEB173]|uniref:FUSC family protein n=1 Tax=Anaerobacillus sp. MEB173 TaxID=3383345 RepID=UPI003F93F1C6